MYVDSKTLATVQDGQQCSEGLILPWFAVRVRSKHESVTATHLRGRGYEEFVPTFQERRQWSDRVKIQDQNLFPGYVFCRFDPRDRFPILSAPGVVSIVGFGNGPTPIPDKEMDDVRTLVNSGFLLTPWPFLEVGQRVVVEKGPLAGVEGVVEATRGRYRLVVSIQLLQRSVATELDRIWIRPLSTDRTVPGREAEAGIQVPGSQTRLVK